MTKTAQLSKWQLQAPILEEESTQPIQKKKTINTETVTQKKQLYLKEHEDLFFTYLSILALLPGKRADLLRILSSHHSRWNDEEEENGPTLNNAKEANKRIMKFETEVEVPESSKLLRANLMMLEIYTYILDSQFSITEKGPMNRSMKYDHIYETADRMREFFDSLQFTRGLAMLEYIQAKR